MPSLPSAIALSHARAAALHRAAASALSLSFSLGAQSTAAASAGAGLGSMLAWPSTLLSAAAAVRDAHSHAQALADRAGVAARAATEHADRETDQLDPHEGQNSNARAASRRAARSSDESDHSDPMEASRAHLEAAIRHETALAFLS